MKKVLTFKATNKKSQRIHALITLSINSFLSNFQPFQPYLSHSFHSLHVSLIHAFSLLFLSPPSSAMALHHRQLLQQICTIYCHFKDSSCASLDCLSCIQKCSIIDDYSPLSPPNNDSLSPPSSYIDPDLDHSSKPHNLPTFLLSLIAVLAAAFLLVFCYAFYARFLSPYLRRRRRRTAETQETEHAGDDDDGDGVHGPILDHPIWYIRTTGLQQSIISAITVCKYKKGEGLIDGTECSVCLSEFEEDESLRLLPKCNHAFHLPCIDTWLRSHTNCPNCRAPIVSNPATVIAAAPEPRVGGSIESGEIHIDIVENTERSQIEEGEREEEQVAEETEEEIEERSEESDEHVENLQGRRRSVSLDESYVQKINLALAGVATNNNTNNTVSSSSSSLKRVSKSNSSSFRIMGASMKRSRSYNGKHLMTSWYGRSQRKSNVPVRSF